MLCLVFQIHIDEFPFGHDREIGGDEVEYFSHPRIGPAMVGIEQFQKSHQTIPDPHRYHQMRIFRPQGGRIHEFRDR